MTRKLTKISNRQKLLQWLSDIKWPLTGLLWVLVLTLGFVGYSKCYQAMNEQVSFWDICYNTLRLLRLYYYPVAEINTELQIARFLIPLMGLYTVIQAILSVFYDQTQMLRLPFFNNHIVICGLGQKGSLLASRYRTLREQVLVIESDEKNKLIENCRDRGAIVLLGDAADPELLRKARAHKAKCVISVCGDDEANAEVGIYLRQLSLENKRKGLSCLAHIIDLQLWDLLRKYEMRMGILNKFRLGFFNVYESGSRVLLYKFSPFAEAGKQNLTPHIIIVGIGRMGESLVVNAVRRWRYSTRVPEGQLRITMVDREAKYKKESLISKYPQLERVCALTAVNIDVNSPEFEQQLLLGVVGQHPASIIYICLSDESTALTTAQKLHGCKNLSGIPIVVRTKFDSGLGSILQEGNDIATDPGKIQIFPLYEDTCTPDMIWGGNTYEILARAIHEDYILHGIKRGETAQTNPSLVPWEELPESLKESNRNQAEHISVKLEQFGYDFMMTTDWDPQPVHFSPDEIEGMSRMEHDRFVEDRLRQGWRYGELKDNKRKTSPTLISWEELSEEEKDKDRNTVIGIPEFLAKAGYQVHRLNK